MVTAEEVGRGKMPEAFLPRTKEFGHESVHEEKSSQVLKLGRGWDRRRIVKMMLEVWRVVGWREGKLEADKEAIVVG